MKFPPPPPCKKLRVQPVDDDASEIGRGKKHRRGTKLVPAEKLIADKTAFRKAIAIDNLRTRQQRRRMEQMDVIDEQTERELLASPTSTALSQTENRGNVPAEANADAANATSNLAPANDGNLEQARDGEMLLTPSTLLPLQITPGNQPPIRR